MTSSDAVWAALFAAGIAYETVALASRRQGDTLSETTRKTFRTHTRAGKVVFSAAWIGFATWYLGHVNNWWW